MHISEEFIAIYRLLFEIKHKSQILGCICDAKKHLIDSKRRPTEKGETERDFLVNLENCLYSIENLDYYSDKKHPLSNNYSIDINIKTVRYKFLVGKYKHILQLLQQLEILAIKLSNRLVDHHPFKDWTDQLTEMKENFEENSSYFSEYI